MFSLVKKDYYINRAAIIGMLGMTIIGMIFILEFTYFVVISTLVINLFYYDNKTKIGVFSSSLPITTLAIVKGRYVFILFLATLLLVFQWGISLLFNNFILDASSHPYIYQWEDPIIILSVVLVMIAVLVPLFYLFKSLYLTLTIQFLLLLVFFMKIFDVVFQGQDGIYLDNQTILLPPFIREIIPFQTVPVIAVTAIVSYYLSIHLSSRLLQRRLR